AYHVLHGTVASWLQDIVVAAGALPRLPFFDSWSYADCVAGGIASLGAKTPAMLLSGIYWLVLPLLGVALGALALRAALRRAGGAEDDVRHATLSPTVVLAVAYGVVSLHYQI